jgi:hypothetical protein
MAEFVDGEKARIVYEEANRGGMNNEIVTVCLEHKFTNKTQVVVQRSNRQYYGVPWTALEKVEDKTDLRLF